MKLLFFSSFVFGFLVVYVFLSFTPRDHIGKVEINGDVVLIKSALLSRRGYFYVTYREYMVLETIEYQVGISRLVEPGVYKDLSLGEIYLPKNSGYGNYYVYFYQEDGDMIFDENKDKLIKSVSKVGV